MRLIHAITAGPLLLFPALADAHVTVWPKESAAESAREIRSARAQ